MVNVFVYGTLRKGEVNNSLLKNAACMAEQCWTNGLLYDTGYGYPAMTQSPSSRIYGELYSVTEEELEKLDQLEGYQEGRNDNLYVRIQQRVYTDKGVYRAFLYIASKENLVKRKIPNGDWKEYNLLLNKNDSVFYFAYGSCMDNKRFLEDGFAHYFQNMVGVGVVTNYKLRFTRRSFIDGMGRADIVEEGGRVEGKVYEIPVKALKEYLYQREGAPKAYRPTFVTLELNCKMVQALTFVVVNKQAETAPPDWYEEEIYRGANGFLSADYITTIKSHIHSLHSIHGGR